MNGNNIIVYQQTGENTWTAIGATKTDTLKVDGEDIEISSATDADWKHFIGGRKSWSLNIGFLVTEVADIRKVLAVNTRVKIRIGGRTFAAATGLEGYALIKSCDMSLTRNALSQGSMQLIGDGPLT